MLFAGVLPYGRDGEGRVHVLLGREAHGRDAGKWSAFAGRPEARLDAASPLLTAAREAHEESCGLLGSRRALEELLQHRRVTRIDSATGVHYLLPMQYSLFLPLAFAGVREAMVTVANGQNFPRSDVRARFFEKDAVRWFTLDECARDPASPLQLRPGFAADFALLRAALERAL